ncbi:Target of rapamycin [Fasciola gigantica]|uniref:Serine/threonine-protein kinase TOR n=1 Tax=Fasciola gigantica TaxID=46835 RepID=A0A504Y7H5_FASGI|nr:Target of rapamycin [Fasciola gigantica]
MEAVKTCARLMVPWLKSVDSHHWYARPAVNTVADILGKLLIVGTSDPAIRVFVYRSQKNPPQSPVLFIPTVPLTQILDNLAHSGSTRNKEQSALLLACLVASAPNFFIPYAEPVIQILIPRIRQALPVSMRASLAASAVSRLREPSSIFATERCESVCATTLGDQPNSTAQAMHAAVLATQLAANAAVATANAVAAAAAAATAINTVTGTVAGLSAGVLAQQQANRLALSKRGTYNAQNSSSANAVAMATNAAATAATAAAIVLQATGQYMDGAVPTGDGSSNRLSRYVPHPGDWTAFTGTYMNEFLNHGGGRTNAFQFDVGCDRPMDPPGGPGGIGLALQIALNRLPATPTDPITATSSGFCSSGLTLADAASTTTTSPASTQWTEPTSVIIALFTALGRLSAVAPCSIRSYMDEFIPVLCWMMQDSCLLRRSIAVWTLSRLTSNAGFVVTPYRRHPQLLQTLLEMLKREESKEIRQEVLRALGVLGALDPFKVKLYSGQVDTFGDTGIAVSLHEADEKKDVDITQSELVVSLSWENKDVFFSVCALSALIQTLRDPALRSQYGNIVRTIVYVLKLLGTRSVYYMKQLMPDYFKCLRETSDVRLQEFLIRKLGSIMSVVRLHTKEFAHEVIDLLIAHWWLAPNVQNACITVLSSMVAALGAEFRPYLTRLIPVILRTLHHETSETNLIASSAACFSVFSSTCDLFQLLEVLPEFGYTLESHAHLIVPAIAKLVDVTSESNLSILLNTALEIAPNLQSQPAVNAESTGSPQAADESDIVLLPDVINATADLNNSRHAGLGDTGATGAVETPDGSSNPSTVGTTAASFASDGVVGSVQLRRSCLDCLARFTDRIDLDDLAGQIVHPICRLLMKLEACHQQFQYLTQHHHHMGTGSSSSSSGTKSAALAGTEACVKAINTLHPAAVDVLTGLLLRMGQKFKLLLPVVQKTLNSLRLRTPRFYMVLGRVEKGAYLPTTSDQVLADIVSVAAQNRNQRAVAQEPDPVPSPGLLRTNGVSLERAWGSSRIVSRDDWDQWLKTLTTALLRESPSPAIRACSQLTAIAPVIGRTLFNAAFVSCWPELTPPQQDSLISTLEWVLRVADQSPDVSQTILNLEEFMAHVDKYAASSPRVPLPLSLSVLADRAMKNRAYAKALYYKEQEFLEELEKRSSPSPATLSCLLTIYSKLQLEEAAAGVLIYATRNPNDKLVNEEVWREKLHDWKHALNLYERKLEDDRIKDKNALILGRMRCLRALGQWAPLNAMAWERWEQVDENMRAEMAPLACSAAWATNSWDQVEKYVSALPANDSFDGAFYRAVLKIHSGFYSEACDYVAKARNVLDADLTTMAGESYDRAYADLVGTQLLSEAEEVIQYKLVPDRRPILREVWRSRLRGCQAVVEDWGQIIQLRSLVMEPQEDLKTRLRFVGLCRRNGRFILARQLLQNLLGQDPASISPNEPIPNCDPAVVFAYTKLLWSTGAYEEAVTRLCVLKTNVLEPKLRVDHSSSLNLQRQSASGCQLWSSIGTVSSNDALDAWDPRSASSQTALEFQRYRTLMAKCCLRLGSWYSELYTRSPPGCGSGVGSDTYYSSTSGPVPRRSSRSTWAPMCGFDPGLSASYQLLRNNTTRLQLSGNQTRRLPSDSGGSNPADNVGVNVSQAWEDGQAFVIQCYRAATIHAPDNRAAWQSWAMANYAVFNHLDTIKARIERAEMELNKVGSTSPSPHSLNAAGTGGGNTPPAAQPIAELVRAKTDLQRCMELHAAPSVRGFVNSISLSPSANMQDSLRLINLLFKFGHLAEIREVIREGLTKISLENWLLIIQQLLARIDTPREYVASIIIDLLISVGQRYPQSLVYPLVLAFKSGGSDRRRYNANRILYSMEEHSPRLVSEAFLFSKQVNNMTTLELSVASPRLHEYGQNWQLAVPGSYEPHRPLVRISGIKNCLTFMTSKQHPRKLTILGSNGHQYMFLLKGHEDTRQDERVMQFFGLVNTLLMNNAETLRRNLTIQRMSIIPLSTNTGLIGWVPNSDTLHGLIRDYREKTGTMLNKENREMLFLAPDFDRLNVIQKTEIFEAGLRESSGRDLANILWLKSHSSEAWFERRTNFVRSMATMSMVGYILGLGDRHPSNIMLSRETGKVVHIDFGDCFEVAMMREKFPEKVPFRLTRMIIAAMEVTGIDGVYRQTCEMVLSLVRTHRESLLAVLEAFIYDPLLQWVLLENRKDFTHLDNKVDDPAAGINTTTTAAVTAVAAAPGPGQNGVAPVVNGIPAPTAHVDPNHRLAQGAQTTTARRPVDRTGGLVGVHTGNHLQPNHYEHQTSSQPHSGHASARCPNSPRRVFTNPNHPDSLSLRDPHKINPWRHHLCNGPWFGRYEKHRNFCESKQKVGILLLSGKVFQASYSPQNLPVKKRLHRTQKASTVLVSATACSSDAENPLISVHTLFAYPVTWGNTRARTVMEKIRQKLTGTEREHPMDVSTQVDYLIREATSNQNLCQMYIGWCAFW